MNVVIVANHDIELTREIASKVASYIVVLDDEIEGEWGTPSMISIRAPMSDGIASSPVEQMAWKLARDIGLVAGWNRPLARDRAANFDRDYRMVENADRVMAFFREDRLMEGGTGHVVQAALLRGVPVEAWVQDSSGNLTSVGSDDGFEVGMEGSRWMQLRYLEWQAREVEAQFWGPPFPDPLKGLAWNSASPAPTYIGTVTGFSINGNDLPSLPAGSRLYISSKPDTTLVSSSTLASWPPSLKTSFTEPPSG